jgi:putative ABC transport system permease protein
MRVKIMLEDVRFALRRLGRSPGFSIAAIGTIALGIGANTAIFSVVSGVLLRPLPFADPDRLVQLQATSSPAGIGAVAYLDMEEWRKQSASFDSIIAYSSFSKNLQGIGEPERIATISSDRGLFRMLGAEPIAGRTFRDDDPLDVVVIGAGIWKRRFGGDPSMIGRKITLDSQAFTVIGVMPEAFQFPYRASYTEFWIPSDAPPQPAGQRLYRRSDFTAGRLKRGVTIDAARNELSVISKRLEMQYPDTNKGHGVRITPLSEMIVGGVRNSLLVLLGSAGLVLLVACANVANLLLARAAGRRREVAIRAALGAGRLRLIRQFLTESVLLAFCGGLLGLAIASWGAVLLLKLAGTQIPRSWEIGVDWRVFTWLLAVCVVTGIGFGLAPAIAAARADVQKGLKESGGHGGSSRGRFRDGLVVAEVALAFMLLTGAGLLLRAFLRLQNTRTGMAPENVLTLQLSTGPEARYYYTIEERVRQIPGVRGAGFIQYLPLRNSGWNSYFTIDGRAPEPPSRQPSAELRYVTPGYFRALGIPLRRGRGFSDQDNSGAPRVVLINEALARQYFPNEDPIGKRTDRGVIAGIVGDVRQFGLDRPPAPEIYYPMAQSLASRSDSGMSLVVSAQIPPENLVSAVRAAIREINPNQAVFNIKTMQRVIADSLSNLNLYLWLIGLFAGLALLLAVAGIYGVIAYAVAARMREFGIRVALGADAGRLLRLVLGHGAWLIGLGLAAGLCGALALTGLLRSLLAGVTATDPLTFTAMAALLASVGLLACLVPARRATRVDPAIALRDE